MRALVLLALLAIGCGGRNGPDTGATTALVVIRCEVEDATVWVDGHYIQEVGAMRGGVRVKAGIHRLEVRHDEFFSHYAELELAPGERRVLDVNLAPVLP
jgi:hypothetical protein